MKIKTLTSDSVSELDAKINSWLSSGWKLIGDMTHYRYKRQHAVHGYDVWETKFAQRIQKDE